ncbi:MAG: DUF1822 family protein [Microcystaceae cyanobacterium]
MTTPSFSIPLTQSAHQEAQQFYQYQKNPQKAKETYLNCLAVYAVNYYLGCLAIATNKRKEADQQAIYQTLANMADLEILDQGKIECRPVLPNEQTCYIPAETWQDRIGYVAVKLNNALTEARLIGFLENVQTEEVALSRFQSIDKLWDKLCPSSLTCLSEWLQQTIAQEWQILREVINPQFHQLAVRQQLNETEWIERGKLIQLTSLPTPLVLGAALKLTDDSPITVAIEVYPDPTQDHLPAGLTMQLLDQSENQIMQAVTQEENPYLRFLFQASPRDQFIVEIIYQSNSVREKFVI